MAVVAVMTDKEKAEKDKADREKAADALVKVGFKDLFQYADGFDKFCYVVGGINAAGYGIAQPAIAFVFGELFDTGMGDTNKFMDEMTDLLWIFALIGLVSWVTATFFTWLYDLACARQTAKFRNAYFDLVVNQDAGWFDEKDPMTIPSRAMTDVRKIKEALGKSFAIAVQNFAQFLGGFVLAFVVSWKMSLVMCCMLPMMAGSTYWFASALQEINGGTMKYYVKAGAIADEIFGAVKTVISFGAEKHELERYGVHLEYARQGKARSGAKVGFQVGSLWGCCFLCYALAFWYGSILVADGVENDRTGKPFTGGDVLKVFFCILMGMFGIGSVAPWVQAYAECLPALKNLKKMREDEKPKIVEGDVDLSDAAKGGKDGGLSIEATDVTFTYPTRRDTQVLKGMTFSVKAGQKIAFVGESGCGKSTMIQLLERFYDADSGSIKLNGHDIKSLSFASLGKTVGYVAQEPVLFNYSIRENLCFGFPEGEKPSDEDIKAALKQAQVWDMIDALPDKLDTLPGTAGSQFSGGQKQRIAIARALVRKPRLLLLDEATSALDYASEKQVQQTLDNLTTETDMTVAVVAHRLSTVRNCDQIFFLSNGAIAERGTHEELMSVQGGYYRLTQTQETLSMVEERAVTKTGSKEGLVVGAPTPEVAEDAVAVVDAAETASKGSKGSKNKAADGVAADQAVLGRAPSKEALDLLKTEEEKEKERMAKIEKEYNVPMKRLLSLNTRRELMFYPLGFLFSLCNGSYQPLCAYFLTGAMEDFYIVDDEERKEKVLVWAIYFVIMGVGACFTYAAANGCYAYAGSYMTMRARRLIFATYMKQEMAYFDDPMHTPGRLTAALESQASDLSYIAGESLGVKVESLSAVVCGVTFAFIASWKLALVVTACLPPMIISMIILFVVIMGMGSEGESPDVVAAGGILAEAVLGMKTVRAMRAEKDFLKTYTTSVQNIQKRESAKAFPTGFAFGFSNGVIFGVYVVGFWYGAHLVKDEGLSATDMFRAVMCIIFAGMGAGQAGAAMPSMAKAKTAAHDIFELVDRVPAIDSTEEGNATKQEVAVLGQVRFEDVHFAYPSRATVPILKGLSLSMNAGQSVALAGPSGSGKSTIMALLMRYYDAEHGDIKVGESGSLDLKSTNLRKWRQKIGYVGQEPVLFNLSALDNILYGVPLEQRGKYSNADVKKVAAQANVNFIGDDGELQMTAGGAQQEVPQITNHSYQLTWDELLGPRGNKISGGQKQRIAIARALMRDPEILMLDEATSALDSVAEAEVQETLDRLQTEASNKRLTITIAHRLSTITNCDLICVLADGVLLEQGSHEQLLAQQGLYHKLLNSQGRKK